MRIRVVVEQRVQVKQTRFRVPDACVLFAEAPTESIIARPSSASKSFQRKIVCEGE
jgi:hypothetical protein